MARIRSIKPDFFTSDVISGLGFAERLTFIGLWTASDDEGRGAADPRLIKAALWPLDDAVTVRRVERVMQSLAGAGLILLYNVNGRNVFQVTNWKEHQRVSHPSPSRFPAPDSRDEIQEASGMIPEDSCRASKLFPGEGKGRERKGKEGSGSAAVPRKLKYGWLAPIRDVHEEIFKPGSFTKRVEGRFAASWNDLVRMHGAERCAAVWRFAKSTGTEKERGFRSIENVAENFATYDPTGPMEASAA